MDDKVIPLPDARAPAEPEVVPPLPPAPITPLDMARATRDPEMLAALDRRDLRETRHLVIEDRGFFDELRDDWLDFVDEVKASPYSHGLVAIAGFIAGILLIILPALLAARAL